jgi:tetratricopeptide (TPR) repeat protein
VFLEKVRETQGIFTFSQCPTVLRRAEKHGILECRAARHPFLEEPRTRQNSNHFLETAMRRATSALVLTAVAILGLSVLHPAHAQTDAGRQKPSQNNEEKTQKFEQYTPPQAQRDLEQKVLSLLSAGHQSEAEDLLAKHIGTISEIKPLLALISDSKKSEAFNLVKQHAEVYAANQRLIFLHAACMRSRFEIEEAFPFFIMAAMAKEQTVIGQCAFRMFALDGLQAIRDNPKGVFADLEKMVDSHPDEIAVRWMLAVACRSYNRNEQGVIHYKKILEKWNPGPVLVHQTYGNLLDELKRFDEAIVERRKAIELEPAGWSYQGLGNTLDSLGRYDEASKAFAECIKFSPKSELYWTCWAKNAMFRKQYGEAIEKCEHAVKLDENFAPAWLYWGECLEKQGKKTEALKKYREALERFPSDSSIEKHIADLEKR